MQFRFFVFPCQFLTRMHFWRFLHIFCHNNQNKKRRRVVGVELDFPVLPSLSQSKQRNEDWFRGCVVVVVFGCVCVDVPSVCCEYMCVGWLWFCLGGVRLSIVCSRAGHGLCLCFVSSALSLSVLSHCFSVSFSLTPFNLLFDLHLNLITFTRKYYLYYVCFLFFFCFL